DFEFAYWAALIAMGIAGFISYLRMQKTHNIVVSVGPPTSPAVQTPENISQPIGAETPVQETSNFDIAEWFSKNKKVIGSVVGIAVFVFAVYYFYIPISTAFS
ncbi:hypothetical protein RZS08_61590, partial [Arthrospira platensis SPKY1]|nr:hypothetical protein [Arthrospira platensis SPKY1]